MVTHLSILASEILENNTQGAAIAEVHGMLPYSGIN